MDAFRMFDYEGKGYVTSIELWQGLTMMEVTATTQDVLFFIKRYDRLETGRLRYSDFCDAFLPLDTVSSNQVCKRKPKGGDNYFCQETLDLYKLCWFTHFANELEMDDLRAQLKQNVKFDAYSCFQALDSKSDGYIDRDDLITTFQKEGGQKIKENEIQMLIERYERKAQKDGRISYS